MRLSFSVNVLTANLNFPGYSYLHLVDDMLNKSGKFRRKYLGCFYLGRREALGEKLKRDVKNDIHLQYTNWEDRSKMIADELKKSDPHFIVLQETNLQMLTDIGLDPHECVYAPYALDIGDKTLESKLKRGTAVVGPREWKMCESFQLCHEIKKKGKNQTRKAACGVFYSEQYRVRILVSSVQLTGYNPRTTNTEEYHFGDEELTNYLTQIDKLAEDHGCSMSIIGGDFNQDLKSGDHTDDSDSGKVKRRSQILSDFEYNFDSSFENVPTVKSNRCLDYVAFKHYSELSKNINRIQTGIKSKVVDVEGVEGGGGRDFDMSDHKFVLASIDYSETQDDK